MGCLASGVLASVFQIGPDFHQIVLCWVIHFLLGVLVCASPRLQLTSCAAVMSGSRAWPSVYSAGAACLRAGMRAGGSYFVTGKECSAHTQCKARSAPAGWPCRRQFFETL